MIIGRDTSHLGPSAVRASHITCSSAVISWLPANSNHQHVVCVNNVEVRTVKPGMYRHTITGLAPSTQYRVTVRAKHLRAVGQHAGNVAQTPGRPGQEEAPGAYADFRTLTKGLPDPPQEIQLEAGPQDGTILVTWQPVNRPTSTGPVTGYAVYADGKKVTDINSPTGDHALIDIGKLGVFNPRAVTIRTKSRDSQSADSAPILIPSKCFFLVLCSLPVFLLLGIYYVKWNNTICAFVDTVRNAVARRGPNQMGMGPQLPQGPHQLGVQQQLGVIPGQSGQPGQPGQHMMGQQMDHGQYDPNQMQQQGMQPQPGQPGHQVSERGRCGASESATRTL